MESPRRTAGFLVALVAAGTAACKDPPPRPGTAAEGARNGVAGAVSDAAPTTTPAEACAARPLSGLPLFDRPLEGRIGEAKLAVETPEVVRGGLAFPTDRGRIVVPIPGAGRTELRILATPDRLAGIGTLPKARGRVRAGDRTMAPHLAGIRLDLSPMQGGRASGLVTLCLDRPEGFIAGRFEARVDEDISDRPDPTRDHPSAIRHVVARALEARGIDPQKVRHRGVHLDPKRKVAYDHVVAAPKAESSLPWPSRSFLLRKGGDGAWTVVLDVPGNRIPEAAAPPAEGDPMGPWIRAAASAVQERLSKAKLTGYASRIEVRTPPEAGKVPERAVVLVTVRPDRPNARLGKPRRFRVEAERRDGGVRVTKVERLGDGAARAQPARPTKP